jgi:hypothetical protein
MDVYIAKSNQVIILEIEIDGCGREEIWSSLSGKLQMKGSCH